MSLSRLSDVEGYWMYSSLVTANGTKKWYKLPKVGEMWRPSHLIDLAFALRETNDYESTDFLQFTEDDWAMIVNNKIYYHDYHDIRNNSVPRVMMSVDILCKEKLLKLQIHLQVWHLHFDFYDASFYKKKIRNKEKITNNVRKVNNGNNSI